jgi:hypothetical protein
MDVETLKFGKRLKKELFNIWKEIDDLVRKKFDNLNGKTSKYSVPDELFQNRTPRKNRVLIPWKTILNNKITIEQLATFEGGVCVEFVNYDFFDKKYLSDKRHVHLVKLLGSDGMISSIISFRTLDGDPGGTEARESYSEFLKLIEKKKINIKAIPISRKPLEEVRKLVNKPNLKKISGFGANDIWIGNIYFSIKGGEQISRQSHKDRKELLFNPAVDYANENVCLDIDLTMSFFALHCFDLKDYINPKIIKELKNKTSEYLKNRSYDTGNLYDYCVNHPSLNLGDGFLIDAIQLTNISINNFKMEIGSEMSSVICHNEAANKDRFYFDKTNNYILSPARPTNLFWSTHLSNMMQQNYNLDEYFEEEEKRYLKRKGK